MKALALMPCCWPRRREFARANSDELRELAHLMCLKASSLDTYAAWAQHLWGTLVTAAAKAAAESGNPTGEMAIGVHRDPNILSEKNLLLTALKTGSRGCRSTASAQKRYVASARAGTWYRYAALREVYGMSIEHPLVDAGGGGGDGGWLLQAAPVHSGSAISAVGVSSCRQLTRFGCPDSASAWVPQLVRTQRLRYPLELKPRQVGVDEHSSASCANVFPAPTALTSHVDPAISVPFGRHT